MTQRPLRLMRVSYFTVQILLMLLQRQILYDRTAHVEISCLHCSLLILGSARPSEIRIIAYHFMNLRPYFYRILLRNDC